MSLERTVWDILVHDIKVFIIISGIVTLIAYFVTQDESVLYGGLIFIGLIVFGSIARFRFWGRHYYDTCEKMEITKLTWLLLESWFTLPKKTLIKKI